MGKCLHFPMGLLLFYHRAPARERDGAKRNRACTAEKLIRKCLHFPMGLLLFIIGRQPVSETEHVRSFDTKKNIAEKSNFL